VFLCSILGEHWYRQGKYIAHVVSIVDLIEDCKYMITYYASAVQGHTSKLYVSHHRSLVMDILTYQWGIWQHELYQQIHSSNVSRPSHLCICQYIQHPLPLLIACSIPSSRCAWPCLNDIFPMFIAQSVRIPLNNIIS
jgi:hypothetical protein